MKKIVLAILLISCVGFLFMACEKKEQAAKTAEVSQKAEPTPIPTYNSVHRVYTFVIEKDDSGNSFYNKGKYFPEIGEKYFILEGGEAVTVNSKDGDAPLNLIKCKSEDGDLFWMNEVFVVPNGVLAIVKNDETVIYDKPDKLKPTSQILSKATIVTAYPDSENGFRLVTTWDEKTRRRYSNVYIKADDLSTNKDDVQSYRAYYLAMEGSGIARKTLFETALEYSNSKFYDFIKSEYDKLYGDETADDEASIEEQLPETMLVNIIAAVVDDGSGEMVNVRDIPSVDNSSVVFQISPGDIVTVTASTVEEFSVGNFSDKWYKISSPEEGWIFGSFIEPIDGRS